jgi:hypothetical protein
MAPSLLVIDFANCCYPPLCFGLYFVGEILPSEGMSDIFCDGPLESIIGVCDS